MPYALEADNAKTASAARAATGDLQATIEALSASVAALEAGGTGGPPVALTAFYALQKEPVTIDEDSVDLLFDEEIFDLTSEFNPADGRFTAKQDGRYEFFCSVAWEIEDHNHEATYEVQIMVNGVEWTYNGHYGDGIYATRQVHTVVELDEGDVVQCHALQTDHSVSLSLEQGRTSFAGRRFSL